MLHIVFVSANQISRFLSEAGYYTYNHVHKRQNNFDQFFVLNTVHVEYINNIIFVLKLILVIASNVRLYNTVQTNFIND